MKKYFLALSLVTLIACGKAGESERPKNTVMVTKAEYGEKWPFSVDSGELRNDQGAVYFTANSVTYGLNGTALSRSKNSPKIENIWLPDPNIPGAKKSIHEVLEKGRALPENE